MSLTARQRVLGGLLVGVGALTLAMLWKVLGTVFFGITVAYVLYPVRQSLVGRGLSRRVAAAVSTVVGFAVAAALIAPLGYVLYARREALFAFFRDIPAEQTLSVLGFTYVVDVSAWVLRARSAVVSVAVDTARATPVLALKAFLFVLLVYGILLGADRLHPAATRLVPGEYHDVMMALHRRVRNTLFALYVLQAATAFVSFLAGYAVFTVLGYDSALSLAIVSGILQFIPILGPSIVIVTIAATEVLAGDVAGAVLVTVIGLVVVGFLPDALVRPRLASITTGMPATLYFVGFTGGTLSLGVVGIIAGPLVVALLVEVVELVARERDGVQTTLEESSTPDQGADPDADSGDGRASGG